MQDQDVIVFGGDDVEPMGQGQLLALVQADLRADVALIDLLVDTLDADIQVVLQGAEPRGHAQ